MPEYAKPRLSDLLRERLEILETFEHSDNLVVAEYAKLVGKSRRWITYEIQAGKLLAIQFGNKGQRVPVWQIDPLQRQLVQKVLRRTPRGMDTWNIYHALQTVYADLDERTPLDAVTGENIELLADLVLGHCSRWDFAGRGLLHLMSLAQR